LQPPNAIHECNHKSPISNHVVPRNLHLYEPNIMFNIFFIILWLCEGYYWVSQQISLGKAFESSISTLTLKGLGVVQIPRIVKKCYKVQLTSIIS
jgi:hypothetical protein